MAQVAHRINDLFLPERRSSYAHTSQVDKRFQSRLSSLLLSRHGHGHHPRAPCPSPDSSDTSGDVNTDGSVSSSAWAEVHTLTIDKTIAKLAQLGSSELGLIASGFDGSASQYENPNLSYRRRLSQPERDEDTSTRRDEIPANDSKSNISTHRKPPGKGRHVSSGAKASTGSRVPFFNLQTIPPTSSGAMEIVPKPEKLHIPGSYRSDTETSTLHSFQLQSPSDSNASIAEDIVPVSAQSNPKPNTDFHSLAVGALKKAKDRDVAGITSNPNPRLHREPSQATLMSTTSTQQARHALSKPAAGQSVAGRAAEPIVTPGMGHGQIYSEIQDTLSLYRGLHGLESSEPPNVSSNTSSTDDEAASIINHPASIRSSISKLSSFPEKSLPAAQYPMDEPDEDSRTPKEGMTSQPLSYSNTLVHRRKSIATTVNSKTSSADIKSIMSRDVSTLDSPKNNVVEPAFTIPDVVANWPPMIDSPTGQEERNSVTIDPKPLPNSRSPSIHERADQSLDADNPKDQVSTPKPVGEEQPELKMHWIRELLASASSNSLSPQQNAGLSRQKSYATNRTAFQQPEASGLNYGPKTPSRVPSAVIFNEKPKELQQQRSTEPFTRAIQDLESLLKEALLIAKQAADPSKSAVDLTSTEYPTHQESDRLHGAHSAESSYGSNDSRESESSRSEGADEEAHYTTLPAVYKDNGRLRSEPALNLDTAPHPRRSLAQALNQPLLILPNEENIGTDKRPSQESALKSHYRLPPEIGGMGDDEPAVATGSTNHDIELAQVAPPDRKANAFDAYDWASVTQTSQGRNLQPPKSQPKETLIVPSSATEQHKQRGRENRHSSTLTSEPPMRLVTDRYRGPPIQPRTSSARLRPQQPAESSFSARGPRNENPTADGRTTDPRSSGIQARKRPRPGATTRPEREYSFAPSMDSTPEGKVLPLRTLETPIEERGLQGQDSLRRGYSLTGRRHVSLRGASGFSLTRSHRRAPIARDWSPSRKRYVATVTCINTALMGLTIGIYAGEVPAIQYAIVDEHHYTILGNVVFFIGLAITTLLAWPLPLLHGRKPYTLAAFALILPLQFPQALAVGKSRSSDVATWRVALLLPRAVAGFIMGFANINFKTTLLDLFGASLQSSNPHQEVVNINDVRRHGGGMGVWLGIWTWCSIGSIGVGFLIGAVVIGELDVAWGFWLSIILTASALVINVLVPEVRRSPYRRSMAEVRRGSDVSRRVARGEVKMHIDSTGPMWWGEELMAGQKLCVQMLKQPGFAILALYVGWIYGEIIMLIVVSPCIFLGWIFS